MTPRSTSVLDNVSSLLSRLYEVISRDDFVVTETILHLEMLKRNLFPLTNIGGCVYPRVKPRHLKGSAQLCRVLYHQQTNRPQ